MGPRKQVSELGNREFGKAQPKFAKDSCGHLYEICLQIWTSQDFRKPTGIFFVGPCFSSA